MISSKTRSRFNQEKEEEEKEEEGYIKFTKTIQSFQLTLRALFLEKKGEKRKRRGNIFARPRYQLRIFGLFSNNGGFDSDSLSRGKSKGRNNGPPLYSESRCPE